MLIKRSTGNIVEIGEALMRQRSAIPRHFLEWIDAEFGMSQRTAYRYISIAENLGNKFANVANLSTHALEELAAPKTDPEVKAEVQRLSAKSRPARIQETKKQADAKRDAIGAARKADQLEGEKPRSDRRRAQEAWEEFAPVIERRVRCGSPRWAHLMRRSLLAL